MRGDKKEGRIKIIMKNENTEEKKRNVKDPDVNNKLRVYLERKNCYNYIHNNHKKKISTLNKL